MKRFVLSAAFLLLSTSASAIDTNDTRLVSNPAVSANRLAFSYANDLWIANADGSDVRRLTSHPGVEDGARFSPDGSLIAFTGSYERNVDVYVMPATGGIPKRLTFHPGNDVALGFTPDGKSVLFSSPREVYTTRYQQLFTVPVDGGPVAKLPIPHAPKAAYSPDGKTIAYVPLRDAFLQWKHYRGGQTSHIVLFDVASYETVDVPQPEGRCNDTDPAWVGSKLYFRSDRNGEFNLFSYDPATRQVAQLTSYKDFPVAGLSGGAGKIAFEQAGYIHLFDPGTAREQRVRVGVAADLLETRPRFVKGAKYMRNASISPTRARGDRVPRRDHHLPGREG